jgi:hypothetical protein
MERVEATLERQALLGLADSELAYETTPIPAVRPVRSWSSTGLIGSIGPALRLSAAAGLLLALGLGAYFGMNALRDDPDMTGPIVADATDGDSAPVEALSGETQVAELSPFPSPTEAFAARKMWTPAPLASAEPDVPEAMSVERALALAGEGRLIVRVRSESLLRSAERLGGLRGSGEWRMAGLAGGEVAELFSLPMDEPMRIAGPEAEHPRIDVERTPVANVYIAEARLTAESLSALLEGLALAGQTPVFEEISEPAPVDEDALDPREVIWWTGGPSDWAPWIRVPVVLEPEK